MVVVPEPISYDLHKLGWRAFQDLVAVVLQTALGQTFHTFADSNDGGRDGAFFGNWVPGSVDKKSGIPAQFATAGATVAQCKFSVKNTGTLTRSMLEGELSKVEKLHRDGLCDAYVLITNLRVSGTTEGWLRAELARRGVKHAIALDGTWISQQISLRPDLRRYVPRVYGLGDLGQILDDRRVEQAKALMSRLGEDLTTFVPTAAYKQAADALSQHGFALLLGAPAAGKSTIAATLSIAALDEWQASVRRVDSPSELLASWNPHEPNQLFWVDDAFGAIRHDSQLTDEWSRRLDQVMTAIEGGARVILTSRDYIYRQARPHLKEYAYPVLKEQAVVVDVAALSDTEKQRMLYNHLKSGDQPAATLEAWKPHLPAVASSSAFQPEVARRLGRRAFTSGIGRASTSSLINFVEHPVDFLRDVLSQLEPSDLAAMACVYLAGEGLSVPITFDRRAAEAISQMGALEVDLIPAFQKLSGNFLALSSTSVGEQAWRFRHPTIREAFAAHIADDPNLVRILLDGLTDDELFRQVDCGGNEVGTLVNVPPSLYAEVVARSSLTATRGAPSPMNALPSFLQRRCSDEFLRLWATAHSTELALLLDFGAYMGAFWQPALLGRLAKASALPEELREAAVEKISDMAIEDFDSDWLNPQIAPIFSEDDRAALIERIRDETLPNLSDQIENSSDGYNSDVRIEERYARAKTTVAAYVDLFDENDDQSSAEQLVEALAAIEQTIVESGYDDYYGHHESRDLSDLPGELSRSERDPFDDVEAGH